MFESPQQKKVEENLIKIKKTEYKQATDSRPDRKRASTDSEAILCAKFAKNLKCMMKGGIVMSDFSTKHLCYF